MTRLRTALVLAVLGAACGSESDPDPSCNADTCDGCCIDDLCVAGTDDLACGSGGGACEACPEQGAYCSNQACTGPGSDNDASATGDASTSLDAGGDPDPDPDPGSDAAVEADSAAADAGEEGPRPIGDGCDTAIALPTAGTLSGQTLTGFANDYSPASLTCWEGVWRWRLDGPDRVYSTSVPAGMRLTVRATATSSAVQPRLYIVENQGACAAAPTHCLGGDERGYAGYSNVGSAETPVFVVVDGQSEVPFDFDLTTELTTATYGWISPYDPARESIPYECTGPTLSVDEAVALFDAGDRIVQFSEYGFGRHAGSIPVTRYTKTCHPVTGCTEWVSDVSHGWGAGGDLAVSRDDAGLHLWARFAESPPFPFDELDGLVDESFFGFEGSVRLRFSHAPNNQVCVDAIFPTLVEHDVGRTTFHVGHTLISYGEPPGSQPTDPYPTPSPSVRCAGATQTNDQIISTWFTPGTSSSQITGTQTDQLVSRACDDITGCTAWTISTPSTMYTSYNPGGISVSEQGELTLHVHNPSYYDLPIVNGSFDVQTADERFFGRITADCVELDVDTEIEPLLNEDDTRIAVGGGPVRRSIMRLK